MKNAYGYQKGSTKKPKPRNWAAQALASPLFQSRVVPSLRRKSTEGERRGSRYWVAREVNQQCLT